MKIIIIGQIIFSIKIEKYLLKKGHSAKAYNFSDIAKINLIDYYKLVKDIDVIYFFKGNGLNKIRRLFILKFLLRKKVIVHFIGTDALNFLNHKHYKRPSWIVCLKSVNKIFGISKNIIEEMSPYINLKYMPLSFDKLKYSFIPYPKKFTILTYLPPKNPDFYGYKSIKKIIANNQKINFIVLGDCYSEIQEYKNVLTKEINYNIDMDEIYNNCSALLRLTKHDGLSNMVLESLARGKHVIWTQKFNFCHYVTNDIDEIQKTIDKVKLIIDNKEAMTWVRKNYNSAKLLNDLERNLIS